MRARASVLEQLRMDMGALLLHVFGEIAGRTKLFF
jgi:hypothetical protein